MCFVLIKERLVSMANPKENMQYECVLFYPIRSLGFGALCGNPLKVDAYADIRYASTS